MGKAGKFASSAALCPYYKQEKEVVIYCEGIDKSNNIHLAFSNGAKNKKENYKQAHCASPDWSKCPIAKMLNSKY